MQLQGESTAKTLPMVIVEGEGPNLIGRSWLEETAPQLQLKGYLKEMLKFLNKGLGNLKVAQQQVTCTTHGENTLNHCYCTFRQAYHSVRRVALGNSYHNLIHLIPRYRQRLKLSKPVVKRFRVWSGEACERLRA